MVSGVVAVSSSEPPPLAGALPEERLGKSLNMAAKAVREHFDSSLRQIGSSFHTYMVLRHADMFPGVSQRHLAEQIGIEGPTLVRHIDRLVEEGLVRRARDQADRRVSRVELTDEGRAHLARAEHIAQAHDDDFRRLFSDQDLQVLTAALSRIRDYYTKECDVRHRS